MNNKAVYLLKNFSYTLTSNFVSLFLSSLIVLVIPKIIGLNEYGYWQIYIFYSSYVGFLHFGWNDGIYLRYGGKDYNELDKNIFFSQFYMLVLFQLIIAVIIFIISSIYVLDINRAFILQMTSICMLIVNVRYMLLYILQSTNRIKDYAKITMLDRILYCIFIVGFLAVGHKEYKLMIIADLIGKLLSLAYGMYVCHDIVFRKLSSFYFNLSETIENINVGIKLMFSNIASMLIIGVIRFGIERTWAVSTFGKLSLTLSISNLMMLFIDAVGIIMFPILRRTDGKNLPGIYVTMRTILMALLFGVLMLYFPLKIILTSWLPKYKDSLTFMALVFPMCVYEGKMALLINTYLKTLRKEKLMLKVNLVSLTLSAIIALLTTIIFRQLYLSIVSIVLLLAFRCILAEMFLSKTLGILIYKDIILELVLTMFFIVIGWFIHTPFAILLYAASYLIYLALKKKDVMTCVANTKMLLKS